MANTLSAKKNIRQSGRRRARNKNWLDRIKGGIRQHLKEPTAESLRELQRNIDKAAGKGIFKKNRARRMISRFSRAALPPKHKS